MEIPELVFIVQSGKIKSISLKRLPFEVFTIVSPADIINGFWKLSHDETFLFG